MDSIKQILETADNELSLEHVIVLLNAMNSPNFPEIENLVLAKSKQIRHELFGNKFKVMAPVEVSNHCASNCSFCDWRSSNKKMSRLRVGHEMVLEQVKYLNDKGINCIELVGGDDINFVKNDLPELIKKIDSEILVCTTALTKNQYQQLKDIGASGMVTWQETYYKELYDKLITGGPKKFGLTEDFKLARGGDGFRFRLESQERAAETGLQVGLGTMIGLNPDLNFEILSTIAHAKSLDKTTSQPMIVGMSAIGNVERIFPYIAALYLLACPRGKSWVFPNCRVSLPTQIKALTSAGYFTSTEVNIAPGGYTNPDNKKFQQFSHHFSTHEHCIKEFKKHGLEEEKS